MKNKKNENICVIGAGRFGGSVINQLAKTSCSLLLIDKSEEILKNYADIAEKVVIADAMEIKSLRALNVHEMDTVIVAVSDNIEIVAALLELKVSNIIARATSKRHARVLEQIGVNVIIQPEYEAGIRTALIATNSNFIKYSKNLQEVADGFVIGTTTITNEDLVNKEIKDIQFNEWGVSIVLIKRNAESILPNGNTELKPYDLITLIGKIADVTKVTGLLNQEK
ncbi:potassium channel family protein [Mycoplasmopsis gallinarum]|uniref:potassium channel family protein n=1 Tax=Mycoplasmopsis gallinarum TaxID=29557 RepID=UPI0012905763